jgi:transcriptional regulator with XRE-family HTH domain
MPNDDSLKEWYGRILEEDFGEHAYAVGAYLESRCKEELREGESPKDLLRREVLYIFRQGVSEYVRQGVWCFLENERKRRELTQTQLAAKAGVSQPTYSKIRTGEASFESILMFLRALGTQVGALPIPSTSEQTVEGLMKAVAFVDREVLGGGRRGGRLDRERIEWLLHLDACKPWIIAYVGRDDAVGQVVADCVAACISIRLGRSVSSHRFGELAAFWEAWIAPWEVCMAAISSVVKLD